MKNINKKICLDLTTEEYQRLVEISLDMDPSEYLHKYLKINFFLTSKKQTANNVDANQKEDSKEEFDALTNLLNTYGIKQTDIANYFRVGQSSVSLFLKQQSKKSHLYPKFFTHSNPETVIYKIYLDKYLNSFEQEFKTYEKKKLNKFSNNDIIINVIKILAVIAKSKFGYGFNLDVFNDKLEGVYYLIDEIEIDKINNKDIDYLNAKVNYILEYL